jgi:catechol 2,3-dioxygenase-like lactoylglutathione lyase family enzyme
MENVIAKLLEDFERGKMNRRQLIRSLACVGAASTVAGSAAALEIGARADARPAAYPAAGLARGSAAEARKMRAVAVNHISYQVNDYAKTRDFYADLLGMRTVGDNGSQCFLILGDSNTFLIPRNAPAGAVTPRIDHIAYTIEDWDKNAVKAELERRGLSPKEDTENSFHVKDPNGFDLQISGKEMKATS